MFSVFRGQPRQQWNSNIMRLTSSAAIINVMMLKKIHNFILSTIHLPVRLIYPEHKTLLTNILLFILLNKDCQIKLSTVSSCFLNSELRKMQLVISWNCGNFFGEVALPKVLEQNAFVLFLARIILFLDFCWCMFCIHWNCSWPNSPSGLSYLIACLLFLISSAQQNVPHQQETEYFRSPRALYSYNIVVGHMKNHKWFLLIFWN